MTGRVKVLPDVPDAIAPDGSEVRLLLSGRHGGMAHFLLPARSTSVAVHHDTVDEIWYVLDGIGQIWRSVVDGVGDPEDLTAGVCVDIPVGVHFQFRALGERPLSILGATMPPWPGDGEARRCRGIWSPTVGSGPGLGPS